MKSRKPIFGYRMMAFSLLAIVGLGFTVWAHHMFTSGMAAWIRIPMAITTAIIAVPTGIKIFSWLATLWRGVLHLDTPMLFALGFLTTFTLGGISGVMLAMIPFDIHVSATYFIVAHIHYVLFGGSLMTIYRGRLLLVPEDDRADVRRAPRQVALLDDVHLLQPDVRPDAHPRPAGHAATRLDLRHRSSPTSTCSSRSRASRSGASTLVFIYNMVTSWRGGPKCGRPTRGAG